MGLMSDIFSNPNAAPALGLLGGYMSAGQFPQGLLAANQFLAEAPDRNLKRQLLTEELAMRRLAEKRAQQQFDMQREAYLGIPGAGASAPSQPAIAPTLGGPLGSGVYGIPVGGHGASAPSQSNIEAELNRLRRMAVAGVPGAKEEFEIFKYKNTPQQVQAGGYSRNPLDGSLTYNEDPTKFIRYDGKGVSLIPGSTNVQAGLTLATEAPKALLGSAGRLNLRDNPDGTKSPVSELSENPTLQSILGQLSGGGAPTAAQGMPAPRSNAPMPASPAGSPRITPDEQRGRDVESIRILQNEISSEKNPQVRAGLQRELDRMTASQSQPGFPTTTLKTSPNAQPGQGYGKTTAQQISDEANKAYAEGAAKDMVEVRKNIMSAGFSAPATISKYQQLGKLLADVDGGSLTATGTQIASAMNSLGIKIDKNLPNKEAAAALGNEMALQLRNPAGGAGMPGAMSDEDRKFLVGMIPNANQTAQGRKMLIDAQIAIAKRSQQVATFARNYENKYGRLDNGFFEQMQAWSNANPLFGGK